MNKFSGFVVSDFDAVRTSRPNWQAEATRLHHGIVIVDPIINHPFHRGESQRPLIACVKAFPASGGGQAFFRATRRGVFVLGEGGGHSGCGRKSSAASNPNPNSQRNPTWELIQAVGLSVIGHRPVSRSCDRLGCHATAPSPSGRITKKGAHRLQWKPREASVCRAEPGKDAIEQAALSFVVIVGLVGGGGSKGAKREGPGHSQNPGAVHQSAFQHQREELYFVRPRIHHHLGKQGG